MVQQDSGHLGGSSLGFMGATAQIRSQTCSSVMHFGTQGMRCSPVITPTEVAVSGPGHPHPKAGRIWFNIAQTLRKNEITITNVESSKNLPLLGVYVGMCVPICMCVYVQLTTNSLNVHLTLQCLLRTLTRLAPECLTLSSRRLACPVQIFNFLFWP